MYTNEWGDGEIVRVILVIALLSILILSIFTFVYKFTNGEFGHDYKYGYTSLRGEQKKSIYCGTVNGMPKCREDGEMTPVEEYWVLIGE